MPGSTPTSISTTATSGGGRRFPAEPPALDHFMPDVARGDTDRFGNGIHKRRRQIIF
jgi:hypothetical protein